MSRRLELLVYSMVGGIQLLTAWLVLAHHPHQEPPAAPPVIAHAAAAPIPAPPEPDVGAQSIKRHF